MEVSVVVDTVGFMVGFVYWAVVNGVGSVDVSTAQLE
jgi:hypothetical protein